MEIFPQIMCMQFLQIQKKKHKMDMIENLTADDREMVLIQYERHLLSFCRNLLIHLRDTTTSRRKVYISLHNESTTRISKQLADV